MAKPTASKQSPTMKMMEDHMSQVAKGLKLPTTGSSAHLTDKVSSPHIEPINDRELKSINALLAYVSYNQNVEQTKVQIIVEAQFGVDNVAHIRRDDYMRAIEFLVDMKIDTMMN